MKKQLTEKEKQFRLEEQAFKKRWNKKRKLCTDLSSVSKTVGKAPACNTNTTKKEVAITTVSNKKKR